MCNSQRVRTSSPTFALYTHPAEELRHIGDCGVLPALLPDHHDPAHRFLACYLVVAGLLSTILKGATPCSWITVAPFAPPKCDILPGK